MASDLPGPYSIGSDTWPGLARLAADAAQVVRVACAIIGTGNDTQDDVACLRESLQEELGDLRAAIDYVIGKNALDWDAVNKRRDRRRSLYERGVDDHRGQAPVAGPTPRGQHQHGQDRHGQDRHGQERGQDQPGTDQPGHDAPGGRPAPHQHARSARPGPPRSSRRAPYARASAPRSPAASD